METDTPLRLQQRLYQSAQLWAEINDASLSRLGRMAVRDSSFFSRAPSTQGVTVSTLERFAAFFAEAANWGAGEVPAAVADFVHAVGFTPDCTRPSTGKKAKVSGQVRA